MSTRQAKRIPRYQLSMSYCLMQDWLTAAARWRMLRSDCAMAACVAARAAWYRAVYGVVPALPKQDEGSGAL